MLGHAPCPKVYINPSKVVGAVVFIAQAGAIRYARGATLVDNVSSARLVMLLGNATAVQSNERLQRRHYKTALTTHNN